RLDISSTANSHKAYVDSLEKAIEKYLSVILKALSKEISLKVALEDVTRADIKNVVIPFIRKVKELSEEFSLPVIIKLADTLGVGVPFSEVPLPRSIPQLIRTIINETPINGEYLEFHGHNDFHLVVANHISAWLNGATYSNCTLFGVGERAGNCPLEAMLIAYKELLGANADIDLTPINEAAQLFRKLGFNISDHYPLVGENAFRTMAGIHINGLLKNPEVYLPFDPEKVLGIKPKIAINPYSGRAGIIYWITNNLNIQYDHIKNDERINMVYSEILQMFNDGRKHPLSDIEMNQLISSYMPELFKKTQTKMHNW
ncbi:MAG: homocitrate synthase/isopropylmalate synthase family protein, partial [Thermoprotei archaeon]